MKLTAPLAATALAAALALPSLAHAHIKMLLPTPWIVEDDGFGGVGGGNPQKSGPCGVAAGLQFTASNVVTEFKAGETIEVKWTETIDHPGYFRIALAENRADLKDPALSFDANCNVDNSKVPTGPHDNVLADGILMQNNGGPARPGHPNYTHQVTLPNTPCTKCTLQLIQFMENHPPSCIYYHCADIRIVAADAPPSVDAGTPAPGQPDAGSTLPAGDASVVSPPPVSGNGSDAATPTPPPVASSGDASVVAQADAGSAPTKDDSGCSVTPGANGSLGTLAPLGLGLLALWARRRKRSI